jgi:hypothetical protein
MRVPRASRQLSMPVVPQSVDRRYHSKGSASSLQVFLLQPQFGPLCCRYYFCDNLNVNSFTTVTELPLRISETTAGYKYNY